MTTTIKVLPGGDIVQLQPMGKVVNLTLSDGENEEDENEMSFLLWREGIPELIATLQEFWDRTEVKGASGS